MVLVTQAIAKVFQNIVVERTEKRATTPMKTDLNMFSVKKIANVELVIMENGTSVTLDLVLVKNKKDVIGSVWAEHDKFKITEEHMNT